jgi:anti-anti-sigma factor
MPGSLAAAARVSAERVPVSHLFCPRCHLSAHRAFLALSPIGLCPRCLARGGRVVTMRPGRASDQAPRAALSLQVRRFRDRVVIILAGHLDAASRDVLHAAVDSALERDTGALVLDLAQLQLVDTAGLDALADVGDTCDAARCRLVLRGVPERVRRLLAESAPVDRLESVD